VSARSNVYLPRLSVVVEIAEASFECRVFFLKEGLCQRPVDVRGVPKATIDANPNEDREIPATPLFVQPLGNHWADLCVPDRTNSNLLDNCSKSVRWQNPVLFGDPYAPKSTINQSAGTKGWRLYSEPISRRKLPPSTALKAYRLVHLNPLTASLTCLGSYQGLFQMAAISDWPSAPEMVYFVCFCVVQEVERCCWISHLLPNFRISGFSTSLLPEPFFHPLQNHFTLRNTDKVCHVHLYYAPLLLFSLSFLVSYSHCLLL